MNNNLQAQNDHVETVLQTDRLILEKLTIHQAAFILELLNQPSFLRFIGDKGVRTIQDAEKYILQGPVESYNRLGFGLLLTRLKDGHIPIGMCGLIKRPTLQDIDIGFAFLSQYESKGYAFEAASAVMAYGRHVLKLKRIVAIVTPDNVRSIRLLEKLGMKFEAMIDWPDDGSQLRLVAWQQ